LAGVLVSCLSLAHSRLAAQQPGGTQKKSKSRTLRWNPPALDSPVRSLAASPPCPIAGVLEQAGRRAAELVSNLQTFTAQEEVQYQISDRLYALQDFGSETFEYVVSFAPPEKGLVVEEYRNPIHGSSRTPTATQDTGLPEMALIFLPEMQADYEMTCEGSTEWESRPVWVVRFRQRPERPSRMFSFKSGHAVYPAKLKGRAWIASDSGEIVHLETGLMEEIPAVRVRRWFLSIDYAPVQFQTRPVSIWLPQSADGYCDFGGQRSIVYHTFSNFMLFSVQTEQKVEKPKVP
jgi:hypothetical protein